MFYGGEWLTDVVVRGVVSSKWFYDESRGGEWCYGERCRGEMCGGEFFFIMSGVVVN